MARQLWIADAARSTGYPVVEVDGWEGRGNTLFNPKGLLWHHTAGPKAGDMPSLRVLLEGNGTTPGPLSQFGLGRSGTIYIVAAGRCNHSGAGHWRGLDGNTELFGIEAEHTGSKDDPWPAIQLDSYRKLSAAILREIAVTVEYMASHAEFALPPGRKVDPIGINMDAERARVNALMQEETEVQVERPPWLPVELLQRLVDAKIISKIPTTRTVEGWETLVSFDRTLNEVDRRVRQNTGGTADKAVRDWLKTGPQ